VSTISPASPVFSLVDTSAAAVLAELGQIHDDQRHLDVRVLLEEDVPERRPIVVPR
jgi:hypothetical protein